MKLLILVAVLLGIHVEAEAEKPILQPPEPVEQRTMCSLSYWSTDWHFPSHHHGFTTDICDDGGSATWEYGTAVGIPDAPIRVWGTTLAGNYPDNAGYELRSPSFLVDDAHSFVEVHHYFETEYEYDGGNMSVEPTSTPGESTLLTPMDGYTVPQLSPNTSFYAWCVDGEPGWTGASGGWRVDCFDLTAFLGQDVRVVFDFGSDASVNAAGWYLLRVALGGMYSEAVCCLPAPGSCVTTTRDICLDMGGEWHAQLTSCAPNPCAPPPSPANLVALTQGPDRIRLEWEENTGADEFVIERKEGPGDPWELVHVAPGGLTAWEDTSVGMGPTYYYRMRASNDQGTSELSNFAASQCGIIPDAPTDLIATSLSAIQIQLDWTDNSSNEIGFLIERKVGEFGPWGSSAYAPPANTTTLIDANASAETDYVYRIAAYNQYGRSAWVVSNLCLTQIDPGSFSATVVVRRGWTTVEGAEVRVADGSLPRPYNWTYAGLTDENGVLVVEGLHVGYVLRAATTEQVWWDCRPYNQSGAFGIHLRRDSNTLQPNGETTPFVIPAQEVSYTLELEHPVFRFDLTMSTEWDITFNNLYWDSLRTSSQLISDLLFDVTDGQAALGKVRIWDNKGWWDEAHMRIYNFQDPWADTNQYYDCDDWSAEDHLHMGREAESWDSFKGPLDPSWYSAVVHELGHYIFDLKDEYENGWGVKGAIFDLRQDYPDFYPKNYGIMQYEAVDVEMSSRNDYMTNYEFWGAPYIVIPSLVTEQLYNRGHSCWDHMENKLESLASDVDIIKPQPGWYVSGVSTSTDRSGPEFAEIDVSVVTADSGTRDSPVVEVEIFDSGPGSYRSDIVIETDHGPAAGADVYSVSKSGWMRLGRSNARGRLHAVGLRPGEVIRAYHRQDDAVHVATRTLDDGVPPTMSLRVGRVDGADPSARISREDVTAPGAVVNALPLGAFPTPVIRLFIRADEPLEAPPTVWCYHGATAQDPFVEEVSEGLYRAEVEVDFADSLFSGQGLFEITLSDLVGNASTFVAPFHIDEATANEHFEVYQGPAEVNILGADIHDDQLYLTLSCNSVPYRDAEPLGAPVTDMFTVHLRDNDAWPSLASINISHSDSLIAGHDETSLVLGRWDIPSRQWVAADSSRVTPPLNVTSALMDEGGTFCVFASAQTSDETPPGQIDDLGAVPTDGLGAVEMLWTAPGDDGSGGGPVQEYIVAHAESPLTQEMWETATKIGIGAPPGAPGSNESAIIQLSDPGTLYYIAMRSKDEASNLSPLSNIAYVVAGIADANLVPAPPSVFRAIDEPNDEGGAVRLNWNLSYDDGGGKNTVVGYNLYRNNPPASLPESLAVVAAGTTTFVDTPVLNDTIYMYWVSASDGAVETMTAENVALPAQNLAVPVGDFTSDGKVAVNDLAHLADAYGLLEDDAEFDPLFDLDGDGAIWAGDGDVFGEHLREGGAPITDPEGQNAGAHVFAAYVPDDGELWHLDISVTDVTNLAGFQMGVDYPSYQATFIGATGEVVHGEPPLLNRENGSTPFFIVSPDGEEPNLVRVATAIQNASEVLSPDGAGYLARLTFVGPGMEATTVLGVTLMDHQKLLNRHTDIVVGATEAATVLRPFLYHSYPNPSRATAMMRFQIPERSPVELRVFDVSGRLIRTLVDRIYDAGVHGVVWDGRTDARLEVATGVYFYRLETDGYTMARKQLVLR